MNLTITVDVANRRLKVTHQLCRARCFLRGSTISPVVSGFEFVASNGFSIFSYTNPAISSVEPANICVRGTDWALDDQWVAIPAWGTSSRLRYIARLELAVDEYNGCSGGVVYINGNL